MSTLLRVLPAAALCSLAIAGSAYAQDRPAAEASAGPANLAFVEGSVDVVHEGVAARADAPLLLLDGDVVQTRNGRAEIVFADGSLLHIDHDAELELLAPEQVRLLYGRVMVRVSAAAQRSYVVDTPGGRVTLDARGEFGITVDRGARLEVTVARGVAEIDSETERAIVRAGEMATIAAPGARVSFRAFNSARWDTFAQWAHSRTQGFATSRSAGRLPPELRPYGAVFDEFGRWDYLTAHGYVWFPSVAASWRPYYEGSWGHTRYGWTWYGHDRWAWPTHHYGRWGFNGISWYWIPARVWGPAWVTWAVAPGYVSWSPLGWDGLPAIGLWPRRDHPAYAPDYNPWRGWTIMPRDHFGPRRPVRAHAIDGTLLDEPTRRAMIVRTGPLPLPMDSAVPRGSLSVPGATGTTRRDDSTPARPGNVRSPAGPYAVGPRREAVAPRQTLPRRPVDAPAYAPVYAPPAAAADSQRRSPSAGDPETPAPAVVLPRTMYGTRRAGDGDDRPVVTAPPARGGEPRELPRTMYGTRRSADDPQVVAAPPGPAAEPRDLPKTMYGTRRSGEDRRGIAAPAGRGAEPRDPGAGATDRTPQAGPPSPPAAQNSAGGEGAASRGQGGRVSPGPAPRSSPPPDGGGARRRIGSPRN